jgi:hypothetical protein
MTSVADSSFDAPRAHVGELRLRRFRLGEFAGAEHDEIAQHTAVCAMCRARLDGLADEQRAFEQEIPFARFAGGVERAHRVPAAARPAVEWHARPRRRFAGYALMSGLAAAAALVLVVGLPLVRKDGPIHPRTPNGIKGGAREGSARIADASGHNQRTASSAETLRADDWLRLGFRSDAPAFVAALAIDDAGVVTPLYPESGASLAVAPGREASYLPQAIQLTGHGRERVYLVLADQPFTIEALAAATKAAYQQASGDLALMPTPALAGATSEAFTWLFGKP